MRFRLSRVFVEVADESAAELQSRLVGYAGGAGAAEAISTARASGAGVMWTPAQKTAALNVIDQWMDEATIDGLPAGIYELRNALEDELADGELG